MSFLDRRRWLFYCLLAIVIFGVWGVIWTAASAAVERSAGEGQTAATFQVVYTLGLVPVSLLLLLSRNLTAPGASARPSRAWGVAWGIAAGLCGAVGNLAVTRSLSLGGQSSAVYPLTGMYPLVTVLLAAILLRERLNPVQVVGLLLAVCALYLFNAGGSWREFASVAPWMRYALAALVLWGVLAVFQKLASRHVSSELSTVAFTAAFVAVAAALAAAGAVHWRLSPRAWALSLLYGVLLGAGTLVLFAAYRTGKASVVTALSALYPALTVVIAIPVFGDRPGWRGGVAILLALGAAVALSYEREPPRTEP